jgi:hypothetical protein
LKENVFISVVPITTIVIFILSMLLVVAIGAFAGSVFRQKMRSHSKNNQQQSPNGEHNNITTENRQRVENDGGYLLPLHEPQIVSNLEVIASQQRQKQRSGNRKTVTGNDQLHVSNDGYELPLHENTRRRHFITLHGNTYITASSTNANQQTQQTNEGYELPLHVYSNAADDDHAYDQINALNENQYDEI